MQPDRSPPTSPFSHSSSSVLFISRNKLVSWNQLSRNCVVSTLKPLESAPVKVSYYAAVAIVLAGAAIVITTFRLYIRFTKRKLWWDDFWVFLAGVTSGIALLFNLLHLASPCKSYCADIQTIVAWLTIYFSISIASQRYQSSRLLYVC